MKFKSNKDIHWIELKLRVTCKSSCPQMVPPPTHLTYPNYKIYHVCWPACDPANLSNHTACICRLATPSDECPTRDACKFRNVDQGGLCNGPGPNRHTLLHCAFFFANWFTDQAFDSSLLTFCRTCRWGFVPCSARCGRVHNPGTRDKTVARSS